MPTSTVGHRDAVILCLTATLFFNEIAYGEFHLQLNDTNDIYVSHFHEDRHDGTMPNTTHFADDGANDSAKESKKFTKLRDSK